MLHLFESYYAPAMLAAMFLAVFMIAFGILFWRFHVMMEKATYPSIWSGGLRRRVVNWGLSFLCALHAGKAWFAERLHVVLAFVAFAFAVWGFLQATATGMSSYFGRSGSLIVVLGFVSIFIGAAHANGLFQAVAIADKLKAEVEKSAHAARAQALSNLWVFVITAVGTLIWGYGDLIPNDFFIDLRGFLTTYVGM